jgi:hypothetical protein
MGATEFRIWKHGDGQAEAEAEVITADDPVEAAIGLARLEWGRARAVWPIVYRYRADFSTGVSEVSIDRVMVPRFEIVTGPDDVPDSKQPRKRGGKVR